MKLSRGQKIALGTATLSSLVLAVIVFAWWLYTVVGMYSAGLTGDDAAATRIAVGMIFAVPIELLSVLLVLGLIGLYGFLVATQFEADRTRRYIWLAAVILTGPVGQAVFFVRHVLPLSTSAERAV